MRAPYAPHSGTTTPGARLVARAVLWPKLRGYTRFTRPIALYWLEKTLRTSCAPGGAARKRDREAFEADFKGDAGAAAGARTTTIWSLPSDLVAAVAGGVGQVETS